MRAQFSIDVLNRFDSAETEDSLFSELVAYAQSIGANLISYHHIFSRATASRKFTLLSHGFPDDWVKRYQSSDFKNIDPITNYAMLQTRPFLWSSMDDRIPLSGEQKHYLRELHAWLDPGDGLALSVFGPSGHHGYAGIGWTEENPQLVPNDHCILQTICECFHLRFCELRLMGQSADFELTDRQERILRALVSGQPDALICGIVNLRPEALQTAIDGLLDTMAVSDRASAILRARGLGLIEA